MGLHVLSGDSLVEPFRLAGIEGGISVFRECLVDGSSSASDLKEFFSIRSQYLTSEKDDGFYESSVRPEIEKVLNSPEHTDIFLWFEHELFCQVNLWFLLHHLKGRSNIWSVAPPTEPLEKRFRGWAPLGPDELRECFAARIRVREDDRTLGSQLWQAFSAGLTERLTELGREDSEIFFFLPEVADAASEFERRTEDVVRALIDEGVDRFGDAFRAFCEKEPVFGLGDLQFRKIWDRVSSAS